MKNKVLLIEPEVKNWFVTKTSLAPNLGLLSLLSYAREQNPYVEFSYASLQLGRVSGSNVNIENLISIREPDLVAITCITSSYYSALEIAHVAKKAGAFVVLGGIFATQNWSSILSTTECIDCIILGEGEKTFSELISHFFENGDWRRTTGIALRDIETGKIFNTGFHSMINLSSLPLPAYDAIPTSEYYKINSPLVYETTRGCLYNCGYCTLAEIWPDYREKAINKVVNELTSIKTNYKFSRIKIRDDTFTMNKPRIVELCKSLIENKLDLSFLVETRIDRIDDELVLIMDEAGIDTILFGIESSDEKILSSMNKKLKPGKLKVDDVIRQNLALASKAGFILHPIFMLGWSGETVTSIKNTGDFIAYLHNEYGVIPYLGFVTPHPGSSLHRQAKQLGLNIVTKNLNYYTHLIPVAYPDSLGTNGFNILIEHYNNIVLRTDSKDFNPIINESIIKLIMSTS